MTVSISGIRFVFVFGSIRIGGVDERNMGEPRIRLISPVREMCNRE